MYSFHRQLPFRPTMLYFGGLSLSVHRTYIKCIPRVLYAPAANPIVRSAMLSKSEREDGGILPRTEHVH